MLRGHSVDPSVQMRLCSVRAKSDVGRYTFRGKGLFRRVTTVSDRRAVIIVATLAAHIKGEILHYGFEYAILQLRELRLSLPLNKVPFLPWAAHNKRRARGAVASSNG